MKIKATFFALCMLLLSVGCSNAAQEGSNSAANKTDAKSSSKSTTDKFEGAERAYFASGCFWCVEAVFESVKGVHEAISGYSGGSEKDATYSKVSSGMTMHAEAVEVIYDPKVVSYETLLKVFFGSHDPTTKNQQGPDRGPQYRSAIFYKNAAEKDAAMTYIAELKANNTFNGPITTEVAELKAFYPAEDYHQDYEKRNPNQGYIKAVSIPRLKRFQAKFPELLKEDAH